MMAGFLAVSALVFRAASAEQKVLAKVGDEVITETDLNDQIKQMGSMSPMGAMALNPEQKKMVLEQVVLQKVFVRAATEAKTSLTPEMQKQLDMMGQMMLIRSYIENYIKQNPPKEEELKAAYEMSKDQFSVPEERQARHILVKTKSGAEKVQKELKAGQKFEKLAGKYSLDSTKSRGGDLGWVQHGMMVPEFETALFALKKGQTSGIVKTQFGFHLIKCEDIRAAREKSYDEAKVEVQRQMEDTKVKALIDSLKAKYAVVINADLLAPAAPAEESKPAETK